jgi:hypothetical protein
VHSADDAEPKVHATRRDSARHEISARVVLTPAGAATGREPLEGWALNMSRGGIRVILEEKVDLGAEFEIVMADGAGNGTATTRRIGRIVWVQDEPDGVIAGLEFRAMPQVATGSSAKA